MRCPRLVHRIVIVLFLLTVNFEMFASREVEDAPIDKEQIRKELLSLLGLAPVSPTINTKTNPTTTSYITRITDNTITTDSNSTIISDTNETYTTNANTNVTSIKNLTDVGINISTIAGNNTEITGNYSLSSANSTVAINESNSFPGLTNDTDTNTTQYIIPTEETNNVNMTTNDSSTLPLNQDLNNLHNGTMNESLVSQDHTASDLNSTTNSMVNTKQDTISSTLQGSNNDSLTTHCSVLPEFSKTCQLPIEYTDQSDSLLTYADVEIKMSGLYLRSCLLKYCEPGEWCLGIALDNLIRDSLNLSSKLCSPTFHTCLASTEANYSNCTNYKKFNFIRKSLELICMYKQLSGLESTPKICGFHLMKLISVTLTDMDRNSTSLTSGLGFCYSHEGYLMVSFNCLLSQCPELSARLTGFGPWKWFTEHRALALDCRPYYECPSSSSRTSSTTRSNMPDSSYTNYPFGIETGGTSQNLFETSTGRSWIDNGLNEEQNEETSPGSHPFGDSVNNSHMMASLSAMMVILMIGMVIMMVVCWKHFRKNRTHRKGGYAKLKTGEC